MEILEINLHTSADDESVKRIINYPIKGKEVLSKGYGVTPYSTDSAIMQFKKTAEYWGNTNKTPVYHDVISFTVETAPTPEIAMKLTEEIFSDVIENHLTIIGVHHEERGPSEYHIHNVYSLTNINDGTMIHHDNHTLYPLAQKVADVTQQPCRLVVKPEDKNKKEFHRIFFPHKNTND